MNERIKKLADEAKNYAYSVALGGDEIHEAYTKKFAELLIRQCMSLCDETQSNYYNKSVASFDFKDKMVYDEGVIASDTIKDEMKKRFGIEQDQIASCPRCGAPDGSTSCGLPHCGWI